VGKEVFFCKEEICGKAKEICGKAKEEIVKEE
jgi:hypothetical protein